MKLILKSILPILVIILTSLNIFAVDKAKLELASKAYDDNGKKLMSMINSGTVDEGKAATLVDEMISASVTTAKEYITFDTKSEKLLNQAIDSIPKMKTMSFTDLEKNYHDGAAFDSKITGINLKDEENEKYTDPVHCMVHPLLTLKAIKDKNLKSAKQELSEGMEQMTKLVGQLSK